MSENEGDRLRHSQAEAPKVLLSEQERAEREARNALLQAKRLDEMIEAFVAEPERKFRLRPSAILDLNRLAIDGWMRLREIGVPARSRYRAASISRHPRISFRSWWSRCAIT